jgi:ATP-dependent protease Clp ATPase subunit
MIAGPGVHICDQCVDLCTEILDEYELVSSSAKRDVYSDMQYVLSAWIDSIDLADTGQIRDVKELLETTLSRLNNLQSAVKNDIT